MTIRASFAGLMFVAICASVAAANERVAKIAEEDFSELHTLVQPCPGESPWREINWLTNVTEARARAVAENKPLVIFTAADGSPLGRT